MDDECDRCGHTRAQQERAELVESLSQWWRRFRGRPVKPAACGSTRGTAHITIQCPCRAPFHGA